MNIKIARIVDYWLGIILCFILTGLKPIIQIINRSKASEENRRQKILFIKLSELGAIVLTYPLLKHAKESSRINELFFLTFKRNKEIFKLMGGVVSEENILTISEDSVLLFIRDVFNVINRLRKENINIVFDLEFFSRCTAALAFLSGADKRVGFYKYRFEGLYRGELLTHKVQYNSTLHVARLYLSLWQVLKETTKNTPELTKKISDAKIVLPRFVSLPKLKKKMETILKDYGVKQGGRLILINPGEGILPLREWPIENFIALSQRILDDSNNYIVIVGNQNISKKADSLSKALNSKRCINLIGKTSLYELLTLFDLSGVLIINDCGLGHLASFTNIEKFIIFGPETPNIFAPLGVNNCIIYSNWPCSPCFSVFNHRDSACSSHECLKVIQPDHVYALIEKSIKS